MENLKALVYKGDPTPYQRALAQREFEGMVEKLEIYENAVKNSAVLPHVSSRSVSDAQRICKFYISWMDNREKNGEEMFGIDYELRYAAERFLNESSGC